VNGTVESVTTDWRGDTLAAPVLLLDTVLEVDDTTDFDEEQGGWLTIADADPVAYTTVDHDAATVTLAAPSAAAYEAGDPVVIWDPSVPPSGAKVVEYVASVMTDHGPLEAVLSHELIPTAGVDSLVGASVTLAEGDDDWYIGRVPGREPVLDGSFIDPATLPTPELTDGDAPDNAPTVTFIGGIGSVFFRWTEITNADPVTYRLHVRNGSPPTTDGTYEVAAGVGLTSAAVRKLKDGTAIVADGSVTYYGIVTVEDADGPGTVESNTASGIPAQVNTADIAANAITAGMLTANSVLADAITATDLTGETITGATLRTAASGERVVVRNDGSGGIIEFYAGLAGETRGQIDPRTAFRGTDEVPSLWVVAPFVPLYNDPPYIQMVAGDDSSADTSYHAYMLLNSKRVQITATTTTVGGTLLATMGDGSVGTGTFRTSVDARVTAVAPALVVGTDTWHTVSSFTNTWTDRAAVGHPPVSYRKYGDGDVRLRGHLTVGGASGTSAFNLPSGWRPDFEIGRIAIGASQLGTPAYLDILANGNCEIRYPAGTTYVSLNSVRFSTA
jgi:hypothetical protein